MASEKFDINRAATWIFFAMIAVALILTSILRTPLSWDGSFYLFEMLDRQSWFIAQPHRWVNYALQAPTLAALHFTTNFPFLILIFSLSYASVPMIGLASSYLVCRKRPELFIWPAIGIGLIALPGAICFNSEAVMTPELFWPVLMASLIGISGVVESVVVAVLALVMLIAHPNAISLLALATLTAFVSALKMRPRYPRLLGALGLALLVVGRLMIPLTRYEQQQLSLRIVLRSFMTGVKGWPLLAIGFTFVAALLCLTQGRSRKPGSLIANYGPLAAAIAAGAVLVPWALNPSPWGNELDYRMWIVPMSMVVMLLCAFDVWRTAADRTLAWRQRQPMIIAIGAIFLIVVTIQGLLWNQLTNRLLAEIQGGGCIPRQTMHWTSHTPFNHWSLASYTILLQGRTPQTLVLDNTGCNDYAVDGTVNIIWLSRHSGDGWFDLDKVPPNVHPPWGDN
jgi:hypothetical protein